jgi:hypothetical protein
MNSVFSKNLNGEIIEWFPVKNEVIYLLKRIKIATLDK